MIVNSYLLMEMTRMKLPKIHRLIIFLALILVGVGAIALNDALKPYVSASSALPDETLASPSDSPTLGNLPTAVQFTYSIPDQRLLSAAYQGRPENSGNDDPLTWSLTSDGEWFTRTPPGGTTPASFWITPTTFSTGTVQTYTGAVTVTVTAPPGTGGSPHKIDLTLQVVDTSFSYVYLPLTLRTGPRYPNDPYYSYQWAWEKIGAPAAWGFSSGEGILIAIVDSGTDLDHPDLASKVRTDIDWDYVNDDGVADDDYGHGTHVSGSAAAATDNGMGVAGMGWEATILPLKILGADGNGYDTDLATAIRDAADNGADVINMSLGADSPCPEIVQQAVDYAYARGAVLVAAAGNNLGNTEMFPANCEHVLGVAATQSNDSVAYYSNYGNHVSVAAPGSEIYSTGWVNDSFCTSGYCYKWGTSMATPHVAGLAALLLARYPSYTPDQIASAILDNAEDLGATGWDEHYGCGRINGFEALSVGAHGSSPLCLQGVGPWSADAARMDEAKAADTAPFAPGEIIVVFQPGVRAETTFSQYGADAEFLPAIQAWRLRVSPGQEQSILARLQADPAVDYAELNYRVSSQ